MVNMTHDGDDRMSRHHVIRIVLIAFAVGILRVGSDEFHLESELLCQQGDGFRIQSLVDGYEQSDA